MRKDALGFFWRDEPPKPKEKKEAIKRTPPEPVWLNPDYLPGLEEAQRFNVPLFTDEELIELSYESLYGRRRHELVFDIECYPNYFLIAFKSVELGKSFYFEMRANETLHIEKLQWVFEKFCVIGFNSRNYDIPIAMLALNGFDTEALKVATNEIIEERIFTYQLLKKYKVKELEGLDHIDIMEVAPLFGSLKIYGGRLHAPRMQDLPFPPETCLSEEQIDIVRYYCINDLQLTELLYKEVYKEIELRRQMSADYGIDLRSKSDAQIAEAVISKKMQERMRERITPPEINPGTAYYYTVPPFLQYKTPLLKWVLDTVRHARFIVSEHGNIGMPAELKDLQINIGGSTYTMGIGGLHSTEKKTAHFSDKNYTLIDRDVTSYYPMIILNLGLFPSHLGINFLSEYRNIVNTRIEAKKSGNKTVADSLKITVNGSFGKLGSKYSVLYSPHLLIQVTVTGQLTLLLLIESLELAGIPVVSANTDGLVIKCPKGKEPIMDTIVKEWEAATGFETEATEYAMLLSRDVNNYIAVKADKSDIKTKGIFAEPGLSKNPANTICIHAIRELLLVGAPIERTIRGSTEIGAFVTVRTVKGGAVKDGVYLGKAIRWYYAENTEGEIVYASSGNKVPRSDGAKPLMDLPKVFPQDIDYDWYINETRKMLEGAGYEDLV